MTRIASYLRRLMTKYWIKNTYEIRFYELISASQGTDTAWYLDGHGQEQMERRHHQRSSRQREVYGLCPHPENLHAGFLTKKTVKNTGQVPSCFVEQNHPAIIDPATFEMVQNEIARRKQDGGRYSGVSIFAGKIKCGECSGWFGAKVWHSSDKYRRVIYRCSHKYGGKKCQTPHVTEREVKTAFVTAFNRLVTEREEIVTNAALVRQTLCDTTELEREKAALGQKLAVLVEMTQNCIAENARIAQDQGEYQKRYNGLVERYEMAKSRFDEVTEAIAERSAKSERLAGFIKTLRTQKELLAEFDERLWGCMVDYVTVGADSGMTVVFWDGTGMRG